MRVWAWSIVLTRRLPLLRQAIFTQQGFHVATSSTDKTVRVWEARSGKLVQTLQGHTDEVFGCHLSYDGRTLASGAPARRLGDPTAPARCSPLGPRRWQGQQRLHLAGPVTNIYLAGPPSGLHQMHPSNPSWPRSGP